MKLTVKDLAGKKQRNESIVMLTSYDYPTACLENEAHIDVQLVGDSVGTNVLGYDDVSSVTMSDMLHHVRAVCRGATYSFVLADMPFGSFADVSLAVENARRFRDNGADGIKMEGEAEALAQIEAVCREGIPVCAHIGYTPQTNGSHAQVQGKNHTRARELVESARAAQQAGAFMIVLELIPAELSAHITALLSIPTIGIGAGPHCDGQVQVIHDILGVSPRTFRHAKAYSDGHREQTAAIEAYRNEVISHQFPTLKNASRLDDDIRTGIERWIDESFSQQSKDAYGDL